MDDLVTWLLTQVGTDEIAALAASPSPWRPNAEHDEVLAVDDLIVCEGFALSNRQLRATVDHIVAWDPTRVLAECETKRQIIESCVYSLWEHEGGPDPVASAVLREYGAMYAKLDRPGYREGWRP